MSNVVARRLIVENFRSIARADIEPAPITVIYGPNSSGKSSLIYALLTLRNIVLKPMSQVSEFFDGEFMHISGFEEVVFQHNTNRTIRLETSVNPGEGLGRNPVCPSGGQRARPNRGRPAIVHRS
ncbi:MAG: AAA family ATPase [Anaerolineae bacterium]|nr:AAA family ATPase [Thermoflexus sp.]MDW8064742.1 AAA family ATPase [Anaerolineae bacterium]